MLTASAVTLVATLSTSIVDVISELRLGSAAGGAVLGLLLHHLLREHPAETASASWLILLGLLLFLLGALRPSRCVAVVEIGVPFTLAPSTRDRPMTSFICGYIARACAICSAAACVSIPESFSK